MCEMRRGMHSCVCVCVCVSPARCSATNFVLMPREKGVGSPTCMIDFVFPHRSKMHTHAHAHMQERERHEDDGACLRRGW
jgi:hypothetical protein